MSLPHRTQGGQARNCLLPSQFSLSVGDPQKLPLNGPAQQCEAQSWGWGAQGTPRGSILMAQPSSVRPELGVGCPGSPKSEPALRGVLRPQALLLW